MLKVVCIAALGFVVTLSLFPIQSEDLFMYLALAREYFRNGSFPSSDPFLLAETNSWTILHQWLSYILFYGIYSLGGYAAIIVTKVALILGTLSIPLLWVRKNWAAVFFWSLSVLIGALAMSFRLVERTSIFSDIFVTLIIGILIKEIESPSRISNWMGSLRLGPCRKCKKMAHKRILETGFVVLRFCLSLFFEPSRVEGIFISLCIFTK